MVRITTGQAREAFSDTLNRVAYNGERIILQRHGKDIAALVPVETLLELEALEDRLDDEAADAAIEKAKSQGTVPCDVLKTIEAWCENGQLVAAGEPLPAGRVKVFVTILPGESAHKASGLPLADVLKVRAVFKNLPPDGVAFQRELRDAW